MLEIGVVTASHPARATNGFLERACKSVREQTLPAAGHFIVNDVDKRGAAWTRQKALEANVFPWTAFLDSDDWFHHRHLQRLAEVQHDTDADYVYTWFWLAYGQLGKERTTPYDTVFPPGHFRDPWDPANPRHTTITVLVRTELAREVGFVTVEDDGEIAHRRGEDWEFTLGCNRLGKIVHVPERTWYWHHHGLNSSGIPGRGDA